MYKRSRGRSPRRLACKSRPSRLLNSVRDVIAVVLPRTRVGRVHAADGATASGLAHPFRRLPAFRALLRCFFPGGPPALPFGVLGSPGFFNLAIVSA
jgi:hypothetical protein